MKVAYCCEKCFQSLAKKRPSASRLWLDLCAFYCCNDYNPSWPMRFNEELLAETFVDFPQDIIELEKLGFILTMDADTPFFRMNGLCQVEDQEDSEMCYAFCVNQKSHRKKFKVKKQ